MAKLCDTRLGRVSLNTHVSACRRMRDSCEVTQELYSRVLASTTGLHRYDLVSPLVYSRLHYI